MKTNHVQGVKAMGDLREERIAHSVALVVLSTDSRRPGCISTICVGTGDGC